MWRTTWKSLWERKLRLLLSTFAIVLGVAFVAGSLVFTATLDRAFQGIMTGSVSDVVVRPAGAGESLGGSGTSSRVVPASELAKVREVPGVARVEPQITSFTTFVLDDKGKPVGGQGAPGLGINFHDAPAAHDIEGLRVTQGKAPSGANEVALDPKTAERSGHRIGDMVTVVTTGQTPRVEAKLVGLVSFADGSGLAGASMVVWDTATAQKLYLPGKNGYTDLWVVTDPGASQQQVTSAVAKILPAGLEARTGDSVADENSSDIRDALSFITTFLLIFAGIALVVGSFLIVNTFSILVAQRSRELALLRALGASKRQITRSVLAEAVVVGLVGSTVGLFLGFALALGIRSLFATFGLDLSGTPLQFTPNAVIAAYLVGMVVTAVAAWLPARRAAKVAPVAALRDDVAMPESTIRRRAAAGVGLLALGIVAAVWVLTGDRPSETLTLGAALFLVVVGAVMACPVLGRPVVHGLGWVFRKLFGTVGNLAEQNAARQPRRTAATASALMIGLALVTMMSVFGASATRSVDKLIEDNFDGDYIVSSTFAGPFSPTIADQVAKVSGVETVSRSRYTLAEVDGSRQMFGGVDLAAMRKVTDLEVKSGSLTNFTGNAAFVNTDVADELGITVGDTVPVVVSGVRSTLRVAAIVESNPAVPTIATSLAGYIKAGGEDTDNYLYINLAPGSDRAAVQQRLQSIVDQQPTVTLKDQEGFKEEQREPIDQMLLLIYALLGLAVIIAVLGIVNTLALSVIERTKEIGLLRAVGLSRRQLRRMVRLESVTIAILGALLGVIMGIGFGIVLQRSQADSGIAELAIPWGRLGLFVVLAAVVGILAAWLPSRRAAKLDVLRAIATD
ncbi:ABC transporter permease [Dermacoccaceae bacterium W4C1]